jgi:predicted fused transcriptional regulator/phosphomethylpyrimidine kinase
LRRSGIPEVNELLRVCFTITDVKALLGSIYTTIRTASASASSVDPTFGNQEHTTHIKMQLELHATTPIAPV